MYPDQTFESIDRKKILMIVKNIARYGNPALYIIAVNVYGIVHFFM